MCHVYSRKTHVIFPALWYVRDGNVHFHISSIVHGQLESERLHSVERFAMMATNTGKQSSSSSQAMATTTGAPFWRLPAANTTSGAAGAGSTSSSISPENVVVVTPTTLPPPPRSLLAISAGNAYSTAIVESTTSSSSAVPVTVFSAAGQQQQPVSHADAAAASFQFCRAGGSCGASAATTTTTSCLAVRGSPSGGGGRGGPRWTDRRNLTQVQEAELQDRIRHLVAECEKQKPNGSVLRGNKNNNKKLLLEGMSLWEADIPVEDILLGVDYRDKYQPGSSTAASVTVAPQWIKAAQAASKKNKGGCASKGDSYGTQATANTNTTTSSSSSSSMPSIPEGRSTRTSKKSGSSSSSSSSSTPLAKNLHTLSLARNRYLVTIPQKLVSGSMVSGAKLAQLQHLDLSSCAISKLPDERAWDLPQLKTLNLALNRLQHFPTQVCVCTYICLSLVVSLSAHVCCTHLTMPFSPMFLSFFYYYYYFYHHH
jgi:hypothetical protein